MNTTQQIKQTDRDPHDFIKVSEEEEIISDLSEEIKKYESSSSENVDDSSVGSLANKSAKIEQAAAVARNKEKKKGKVRKKVKTAKVDASKAVLNQMNNLLGGIGAQ